MNGLVEFSRCCQEVPQVPQDVSVHTTNNSFINSETLTAGLDEMTMNCLHDNIMYYIAGYVTQALIKKEQCTESIKELLEDMQVSSLADHKKLTLMKQQGSLTFVSKSMLKIVQATEKEFKKKVIEGGGGTVFDKNINLKLQSAVLSRIGPGMLETSSKHFFDHRIGQEADHLSNLLRKVVAKYLDVQLKTYAKQFTTTIAHQKQPSEWHHLTKLILFRNQ